MAAPVTEQSNLSDTRNPQEGSESDLLAENVSEEGHLTEVCPTENMPLEPSEGEANPPNQLSVQHSSGPSAFHVVSYPDGHKELTTDILEASEKTPTFTENAKSSDLNVDAEEISASSACTAKISGAMVEQPECVQGAKHFSAKVVQQEECSEKHVKEGHPNTAMEAEVGDEEEKSEDMLGDAKTNEQEAEGMDGVNIEDIDEAVERALLGGNDEDGDESQRSAPEGNTEIECDEDRGPENSISQPTIEHEDRQRENQLGSEQPHVIEKVYNIDEETRMGLDQTPVHDQTSIGEPFTYPSLPPRKLFHLDDTKDSEASDTETKVSSTMTDAEDTRLGNTVSIDEGTNVSVASDSNTDAPTPSSSSRKQWRGNREGIGIPQDGEGGQRVFTAEHLFEYQWPQDGGDWHMLQEQVSEYLDVKSFKRKYPDLDRRVCDKEEKDFLREKGVVTETQSDLGLTALRSEEVYDLMMKDYNEKYQEYITFLQEKQKKVIREKHKEYSEQAKIDKSKMESYSKRAARAAAEFNANMMREKKEERRAYFDLQTYTIHYPKSQFASLPPRLTKVGAHPVAILAGQYQDHYKRYTPEELKYFPVKTVVQDPKKRVKYVRAMPESVRRAILEKQKPPPPPPEEERMEIQESTAAIDNSTENKENSSVALNNGSTATGVNDSELPAAEAKDTSVTPQAKPEKKFVSKSTSKKRPKIELSPERPKKMFKKSRESMPAAVSADTATEEEDGSSKAADSMSAIPKIHGLEKCRICKQRSTKEERKNEKIVKCAQCGKIGHTSCLDLTEELVAVIKTYPWQCMECKTCVKCLDPFDEDKMMFCDRCDRGYHTFCIGLEALPTGHWECGRCEGGPVVVPRSRKGGEVPSESTKTEESATSTSNAGATDLSETGPTLVEKKELLEEGEITVEDLKSPVTTGEKKIERRGRKRKYPIDLTKLKSGSSGKSKEGTETPKIDKLTGERQSRRLKLRVKEEKDKKKKEMDEKALKKQEKWLAVRKLAAQAAREAAAAAAAAYNKSLEAEKQSLGTGSGEDKGDMDKQTDSKAESDLKDAAPTEDKPDEGKDGKDLTAGEEEGSEDEKRKTEEVLDQDKDGDTVVSDAIVEGKDKDNDDLELSQSGEKEEKEINKSTEAEAPETDTDRNKESSEKESEKKIAPVVDDDKADLRSDEQAVGATEKSTLTSEKDSLHNPISSAESECSKSTEPMEELIAPSESDKKSEENVAMEGSQSNKQDTSEDKTSLCDKEKEDEIEEKKTDQNVESKEPCGTMETGSSDSVNEPEFSVSELKKANPQEEEKGTAAPTTVTSVSAPEESGQPEVEAAASADVKDTAQEPCASSSVSDTLQDPTPESTTSKTVETSSADQQVEESAPQSQDTSMEVDFQVNDENIDVPVTSPTSAEEKLTSPVEEISSDPSSTEKSAAAAPVSDAPTESSAVSQTSPVSDLPAAGPAEPSNTSPEPPAAVVEESCSGSAPPES